jgi:hypothetical protein
VLARATTVVRLIGALHRGPLLWTLGAVAGRWFGHDATVPEREASGRHVGCQRSGRAVPGLRRCPGMPCVGGRYRSPHHRGKAGPSERSRSCVSRTRIGCAPRRDGVRFARPPPEGCGRPRKHSFPTASPSSSARFGRPAVARTGHRGTGGLPLPRCMTGTTVMTAEHRQKSRAQVHPSLLNGVDSEGRT